MCDIKNREAAVDTVDMWAKRRESKLLLKIRYYFIVQLSSQWWMPTARFALNASISSTPFGSFRICFLGLKWGWSILFMHCARFHHSDYFSQIPYVVLNTSFLGAFLWAASISMIRTSSSSAPSSHGPRIQSYTAICHLIKYSLLYT